MLSQKMEQALNKQINAEWYSAYLYRAMQVYFLSKNLKGLAHWMDRQAAEEQAHGTKILNYIDDRNGNITLDKIDQPPAKWDSPLAAFQAVYEHEQKVTAMINDLAQLAQSENDPATLAMLQWFITEQVEEESSALEVVEKLKMIKDSPNGLLMLDHVLGQRK